MKKNRLFSLLLALALTGALLLPFSTAQASLVGDLHINAKAAILVDITHGMEILYQQNAHDKMFPASITKVMTGLLTIEAVERGQLSMDQILTATASINEGMISGASTADIRVGEIMTLGDVLRCALIPSANEACNFLGETVSGSISAFVDLMNQRAAELGCENTHFMNPHGLHENEHYTTAYDIALICREAMKSPIFREIVSSKNYVVPPTNLSPARTLRDTNALISNFNKIGYLYQYATGIKTGSTPEAGLCLASSATKGDRSLIAVVLGCERTPGATGSEGYIEFSESRRLLEFGFNNFSRKTILTTTDLQGDLPVAFSDPAQSVTAQPAGTLEATLPSDVDPVAFTYTPTWNQDHLEAPVTKGQVLGRISVSHDGTDYGTLDLIATSSVDRSNWLYNLDRVQKFFSQLWVKLLLVVLLLLLAALFLRSIFFRKRSRYGHSVTGRRSRYSGRRRR